jgi:cobalt-precorrin 5A hydrolase/precorrin-3B C17-methyltransferase
MTAAPALVTLTPGGLPVCERLKEIFPGAQIHGLRGRVAPADVSFEHAGDHLRSVFQQGTPIIGVCAAAVLIRALAPLLADKHVEPPVVAVAEDGSVAVPLLGGHHGAISLSRRVADELGAVAAITTAGDVRFGLALDDPPAGFTLANPEDYKIFTGALLAGKSVRLENAVEPDRRDGGEGGHGGAAAGAGWLRESRLPLADDGPLTIAVTERNEPGSTQRLVYHPRTLAVGVGSARGAGPDAVIDLVRETLAENDLAEAAVAGLFSLDLKADEPAVLAAATALGVPVRFFDAAELEAETSRLSAPSETVFRQVGCHGVAEAAALAAAGPEATLLVPKHKTGSATCAIARAAAPLDATEIGRPRGLLAIVGMGPGRADWYTPEASAYLAQSDDIVAYRLYNELLDELAPGAIRKDVVRHNFPMRHEEERVVKALDLAAAGHTVSLVCSGDPGIYAVATLAFELLDRASKPEWRRPEIVVVPGLSAFQAAAARIGAPIGHDLCLISLSDLLTPWELIRKRVQAAAAADFVVAFYNPVSHKRRHQLGDSAAILLEHRPPSTPVVLARQVGRAEESIRVIRLDELTADDADMLTVVLVGSSQTRVMDRPGGNQWVYTPRGYASKPRSSLSGGQQPLPEGPQTMRGQQP